MCELAVIKEEIEDLRSRLNLAIKGKANSEEVLALSEALDKLIYKFYKR